MRKRRSVFINVATHPKRKENPTCFTVISRCIRAAIRPRYHHSREKVTAMVWFVVTSLNMCRLTTSTEIPSIFSVLIV